MPTTQTAPQVLVRVPLDTDLVEAYEKQAEAQRVPLEDMLAIRLEQTVEQHDTRPIHFNDAERQELDFLLGKNVSSAREIIERVRRALSIAIKEGNTRTFLTLKPNLVTRLKSRCFEPDFEKFLHRLIREGLEREAGLR